SRRARPSWPCHPSQLHRSGLARWWRRLILIDLLRQFGGEVDFDEFIQLRRRACGVGPTAYCNAVARDLNRRHDEAPEKSPPAEQEREQRAARLAALGAGTGGELRRVEPTGEHERRPDFIDGVNVNRAASAAFGAGALMNFRDLLLDHIGRQLLRHAQQAM